MDITLLPPSTILSHHSHLSLLPSALPYHHYHSSPHAPSRNHAPFSSYSPPAPRPSTHIHYPPRLGSSPLTALPDDLFLEILSYLDFTQLLPLQRTSRRFQSLCIHPALHQTLSFHSLPSLPLPTTLTNHLLKNVKNLRIHLLPYNHLYSSSSSSTRATIHALLSAIPENQLRTLNLPFSSPYLYNPDLAIHLKRLGGKLEKLDLRGSALNGSDWVEWFGAVGKDGMGLRDLNLSFTGITDLPIVTNFPTRQIDKPDIPIPLHSLESDRIDPFRNLQNLSLSSCSGIPISTLTKLLKRLPRTIEMLDLSRLYQIPYTALADLQVVTSDGITSLREIRLVGIDHLTRMDIRGLKMCWERKRLELINEQEWENGYSGHKNVASPISPIPIPIPIHSKTPSAPVIYMGLMTPPTTPPRYWTENHRYAKGNEGYDRYSHVGDDEQGGVVGVRINIIHSAILESEDEAGYRQFIGEVVEGTLGFGIGRTGRSMYISDWEKIPGMTGGGGGYVEIDQGGYIPQ